MAGHPTGNGKENWEKAWKQIVNRKNKTNTSNVGWEVRNSAMRNAIHSESSLNKCESGLKNYVISKTGVDQDFHC
jgi:hypothetical protein